MAKRTIDGIGRVVIPADMMRAINLDKGSECNVEQVGNKIIITNPKDICALCGKPASIKVYEDRYICKKCASIIVKE